MIRRFGRNHPRTVAIIVLTGFALALGLPFLLLGSVDLTNGTGVLDFDVMTGGIVWQYRLAAVLFGVVAVLGWWDIVGLNGPLDRRGLKSTSWVAAFPLVGLIGFGIGLYTGSVIAAPGMIIAIVLIVNLAVGLSEEILFRGILFGALRQRHRLITAIALSSVIFGLSHLLNLGIGQSMTLTVFQVVNAAILGVLFCAILLQTNSLWLPIALHMLWNSYIMVGQAFAAETDPFQTPAQVTEPAMAMPVLVLADLTLPLIIGVVAIWVLYAYTRRTGQSLWAVAPTYHHSAHSRRASTLSP